MAVATQGYVPRQKSFPSVQRQEIPPKLPAKASTYNRARKPHVAPRLKEGLVPCEENVPPRYQAAELCVPNDTSCQIIIPEPPIPPIAPIIVKIPSVRGSQSSSLEHSQQGSAQELSSAAVVDVRPSTSSRNEMCRKWYIGVCHNKQCYYVHKVIPSNLTCNHWLSGRCDRPKCPFVHGLQNPDGPVNNGPSVSGHTESMDRDSVQPASPVTTRSDGFSATKVQHPEVKLRGAGSPPSVASIDITPESTGNKATNKVRPATSATSSGAGPAPKKVQKTETKPLGRGRPPSVASTDVTLVSTANEVQPVSSVTSRALDKLRPASSVTSSSAGSSVTKVQKPEMKPCRTGSSSSTASTNDTCVSAVDKVRHVFPVTSSSARSSATKIKQPEVKSRGTGKPHPANSSLLSTNKVRPAPSVTSNNTASSVTQVQRREVKSCDTGKSSPVIMTDIASGSAMNKAPDHPNGNRSQKFCFDWLKNQCTRPRCSYLHERPSNDNVSEKIRRDDDFAITVTVADHTMVKLKDGFEVQDVTTGFESRWVHIGDLPPLAEESTIRCLLEKYGQLDRLFLSSGPNGKSSRLTIKAQYATAAQAMKASTKLHGQPFQGRKLTAKLPLNTSASGTTVLRDTTVRISWSASQRLGYAGYATLDEAKAVIAAATGFVMKDNVLTTALYEGLPAVGAYNVMFCHLPADATRKDLEQFGNAESIMFERPNYQSPGSACEAVLQQLRSYGLSNFELPLPIRNGTATSWATFETHADASNARDHLDGQYPRAMGGKIRVSARHVQTLSFTLPLTKYKMLEGDISRLRWSWRTRFSHDVTLNDRLLSSEGPVLIRISSENVSNLGMAKAEFEQLQHGEVVTLEKKPVWDGFFSSPEGQSFLRELERQYPGIEIQTRMGKILLLGRIAQRQLARRDIMKRFQELQARQRWYIPLSGRAVGAFVSKDLLTLQESVGRENCQILLSHEHTLLIRGNEQTYRIACEAVEKVQSRHAHRPAASAQSVCPVCFNEVSVPTRLACGHSWCTSCLERYLVSAVENKTFPLTCLGNDASCTQRISLNLSKKILSGDDFTALCEASFWSYVHARTREFHHCPTPDCAQVYRATPVGTILQCPSCLVRICSVCHLGAHDGFTCEERDAAEDKLFYEWAATHDVKNCPGCKTPIERTEGCNHMTCIRCQTHICWECMATFPKGEGIYQHMRYEHGGIGIDEAL